MLKLEERQFAISVDVRLLDYLLGNLLVLIGRQLVPCQRLDNALEVRLADKAVFVEILNKKQYYYK